MPRVSIEIFKVGRFICVCICFAYFVVPSVSFSFLFGLFSGFDWTSSLTSPIKRLKKHIKSVLEGEGITTAFVG